MKFYNRKFFHIHRFWIFQEGSWNIFVPLDIYLLLVHTVFVCLHTWPTKQILIPIMSVHHEIYCKIPLSWFDALYSRLQHCVGLWSFASLQVLTSSYSVPQQVKRSWIFSVHLPDFCCTYCSVGCVRVLRKHMNTWQTPVYRLVLFCVCMC